MSFGALGLATALLGAGCFACFTWGTIRHFARVEKESGGAWAISLLSLALFVLFEARLAAGGERSSWAWPWALRWILFGVSAGLWAWTIRTTRAQPPSLAFTGDAPVQLFARGPYRLVRHPFYTAYLAFWAGTALPTGCALPLDLPGAGGFVVMIGAYLVAARHEEGKFARSPLAPDYRRYAACTGRFLPRLRRARQGDRAETVH